MKDNECVEILPDGTVYYYDLNVCAKEAEKTLDELYDKEKTVPNFDATAAMYTVFVEALYVLQFAGITTEELIDEVIKHTVIAEEDDEDDEDDGLEY